MGRNSRKPQFKYVVLGILSLAVVTASLIALATLSQVNPKIVADYLELFIMFAAAGALGVIICSVGYCTLKKRPDEKENAETEKKKNG